MRLFEYEAKELFKKFDIPVPPGRLVRDAGEAVEAFAQAGRPVVIKPQVLSGGRGKAGIIRFCNDRESVAGEAADLIGRNVQGEPIASLLIEEKIDGVLQEYYLGFTIDPSQEVPVMLISREGGVEIESIPDEEIHRFLIPAVGAFSPEAVESRLEEKGFFPSMESKGEFMRILACLYEAFRSYDGLLTEINPLVFRDNGRWIALDAKFEMDDNAVVKHPEYGFDGRIPNETSSEKAARQRNLSYCELGGDVGVCGNGAGSMMMTIDLLEQHGVKAANFCDGGGQFSQAGSGRTAVTRWKDAVSIILSNPRVRMLLVNVNAGNQRCDEVADGVLEALEDRKVPALFRINGPHQEEGRRKLKERGYESFESSEEIVAAAAEMWRKISGNIS